MFVNIIMPRSLADFVPSDVTGQDESVIFLYCTARQVNAYSVYRCSWPACRRRKHDSSSDRDCWHGLCSDSARCIGRRPVGQTVGRSVRQMNDIHRSCSTEERRRTPGWLGPAAGRRLVPEDTTVEVSAPPECGNTDFRRTWPLMYQMTSETRHRLQIAI